MKLAGRGKKGGGSARRVFFFMGFIATRLSAVIKIFELRKKELNFRGAA